MKKAERKKLEGSGANGWLHKKKDDMKLGKGGRVGDRKGRR